MAKFKIKLVNKIIEIDCIEDYTKEYCKDFIVNNSIPSDYEFTITKTDLLKEKELDCNKGVYGSIELSCLYRKIVTKLALENALLFHCSSIEVNGKAYCIAAHSGIGKSTHVNLLRKVYGENKIHYINDDKPLFLFSKDKIEVYGTPWSGKERKSTNTHYPLAGIALLSRDSSNSIHPIDKKVAYNRIIEQIYLPKEKRELINTLNLIDILLNKVPIYDLKVNMKDEAAITSYEGMIERK